MNCIFRANSWNKKGDFHNQIALRLANRGLKLMESIKSKVSTRDLSQHREATWSAIHSRGKNVSLRELFNTLTNMSMILSIERGRALEHFSLISLIKRRAASSSQNSPGTWVLGGRDLDLVTMNIDRTLQKWNSHAPKLEKRREKSTSLDLEARIVNLFWRV